MSFKGDTMEEKSHNISEKEEGECTDDDSFTEDTQHVNKSGPTSFLQLDPMGGVRQAVNNIRKEMADRSHEMSESLKPFLGKVFHAVGNSGIMYRYRVGEDGQLTLEKRFKGSFISVEKFNETRVRILEAGKSVPLKARRRWRAAVTGDPEKRIRDHLKETPQVKMMDKISFTTGVVVISLSEYLLLRQPHLFPLFYYCLMPILWILRYFEYSAIKSELYMLDFCYFVNISVALQTAFYPDHKIWFLSNYVLSMGPICIAIVVWRNSLVFHSLDKITSFFLHAFPPMVCHVYRWKILDSSMEFTDEYMGYAQHFLYPLIVYMIWQIGYLFITEVMLSRKLTSDPEIVTSLRYLSRDSKNSMNKLVTVVCRKLRFLKQDELFDPNTKFAKTVFVLAQLFYTLATILPPGLLFTTYTGSCAYIVIIFVQGVWNGASYYIEVFSKRYNLKFEEKKSESVCTDMPQEADDDISDYSSVNEDENELAFDLEDENLITLKQSDLESLEEFSTRDGKIKHEDSKSDRSETVAQDS